MLKYNLTEHGRSTIQLIAIFLLERGADLFNMTSYQLDQMLPEIVENFPQVKGIDSASLLIASLLYKVTLN